MERSEKLHNKEKVSLRDRVGWTWGTMLHATLSLWLEFGLLTCCVQSDPSCQLAAGRPWALPGLVWQVKRLPR